MKNILLIGNNKNVTQLLKFRFERQMWNLTHANNGNEGLLTCQKKNFDLVIISCNHTKVNDLIICKKLCASKSISPIIMLSTSCEEIDKVLALEMGADAYLTLPLNPEELIARIKAIFRRVDIYSKSYLTNKKILNFQNLEIDLEKKKVTLQNKRLNLSRLEYKLLKLLATHPGKTYTKERILRIVWGAEFRGSIKTIPSQISRLRSKIEPELNSPCYIRTQWGIGYYFQSS